MPWLKSILMSCSAAAGSWTSNYCMALMGIDGGADPRKL